MQYLQASITVFRTEQYSLWNIVLLIIPVRLQSTCLPVKNNGDNVRTRPREPKNAPYKKKYVKYQESSLTDVTNEILDTYISGRHSSRTGINNIQLLHLHAFINMESQRIMEIDIFAILNVHFNDIVCLLLFFLFLFCNIYTPGADRFDSQF